MLKVNIREVRLASTGRKLFDAAYTLGSKIVLIDGITVSLGKTCWTSEQELSSSQQSRFLAAVEEDSRAVEESWWRDDVPQIADVLIVPAPSTL